jgi:hypothetical protein
MQTNSARFQARQTRLNAQFQQAVRDNNPDEIIRNRFAMLGYSYDDNGSGSGSGSALASIIAAAGSIGSAAIIASHQPSTAVAIPTRTNPAFGAAQPVGGNTILVVVLVAVVAFGGLFFAMRS